jgi:hypothetical protein
MDAQRQMRACSTCGKMIATTARLAMRGHQAPPAAVLIGEGGPHRQRAARISSTRNT